MESVAFLGMGLMGQRQARRLLAGGYPVTVWNRSRAKAEALSADGARVADSPADAVSSADLVFVMLESGQVVFDVLFGQGTAEAIPRGATVIDMSSIRPAEAKEHARLLAERGVAHLDAPVSGGTVGAEAGSLVIMVGGDEETFTKAAPALAVMGSASYLGPAGSGQLAKLANQIIVGGTIGAVAEALLLAKRGGADPGLVRNALRGGFADSRVLEIHGARMVEQDFETRGRSAMHLKDLKNALAAAEENGVPLPYARLTAELFEGLIDHSGDLDHSALLLELERRTSMGSEKT